MVRVVVTADSLIDSSVSAVILMNSIDTNNEQRDGHLRSNDFFDIEDHPTMAYRSTGIRQDGDDFVVAGALDRCVPVSPMGSDPPGRAPSSCPLCAVSAE